MASSKNTGTPENPQSRIHSCVLIVCLTFVPLNLLMSLTGISSANTATVVQPPLLLDGAAALDPNSSAVHQLLRAQVHVIDANQTTLTKQSGNRLKHVIEQIRSLRLESEQPEQAIVSSAVPEKAAVIDPGRKEPDTPVRPDDPNKEIESELFHQRISDKTLQMLDGLLPRLEKQNRPLEMGEVLFSSGNVIQAAAFYQEALKRADPNDTNVSGDRAWILFQIGNCLRNSDRSAASKVYGQLLSEYPQSPWAEMAKAEIRLIDWYLKDDPHTLLGETKPHRFADQ